MLSRSLKNLTLASFLWTFIQNESVQSALTNYRYLPVWIFLFRRFSEKRRGSSHSMLTLRNPRPLLLANLQKQPFILQKDCFECRGYGHVAHYCKKKNHTVVIPNKLNRRISSLDKRIGLLSRHKRMMKLPLPLHLPLKWLSPPIRFTIWIQLMHLLPQLFRQWASLVGHLIPFSLPFLLPPLLLGLLILGLLTIWHPLPIL